MNYTFMLNKTALKCPYFPRINLYNVLIYYYMV